MAEGESSRFVNIQQDDTAEFVDKMKNINTKRKTESDLRIFKEWLGSVGELRNAEDIENQELNMYLARFYLSVRTKSKEEYEPDSLKCIQSSINRYLNEKRNINIMKDADFQHSRDVLAAKRKELKGKGLGNKKKRADPFTADEVETLYNKNLLGTSNPEALTNTIWFNNSLHFGMRGRQEHTDMLFGDVALKATSEGKQYLEYCERETKTRKGESGNTRAFAPKMFERPVICVDEETYQLKGVIGDKVNIDCPIESSSLLWIKNKGILFDVINGSSSSNNSGRIELKDNGLALEIADLVKNDSGTYNCNENGRTLRRIKLVLTVLDVPVIYADIDMLQLFCDAPDWSNMTLLYNWTHLSNFKEAIQVTDFSHSNILALNKSVPLYKNNGNYICTVHSNATTENNKLKGTSDEKVVVLKDLLTCVEERPTVISGKLGEAIVLPVFIYSGSNVYIENNDVIWWQNHNVINSSLTRFVSKIEKRNISIKAYGSEFILEVKHLTLVIHSLLDIDFTNYTVTVEKNASEVSCSIQLFMTDSRGLEDQNSSTTVLYVIIACVNSVALVIIIALLRLCFKPYFNSSGSTVTSENSVQRSTTETIHLYEELEMS